MPWPGNFEYILSGVDIPILNVATERTDMRPDTQRLLHNLPTLIAFLRGVAGVHSNDLMSSTLSLGSENIEERAPGGVHDAFREMMVFDHPTDGQVLNGNMMELFGVLFSDLVVEITALALDLQMRVCRTLGSLAASLRPLLPTCYRALLAPERLLALAVVVWVLDGVAFRVREERFQPDIDTDIGMLAHAWGMLLLWFSLAHNQSIPMAVSTQDQMGRLRSAFNRTVQLDFDGAAQLLGDGKMLAGRLKREIDLVLSQLYGMPSVWLLETRKAHVSKTHFTGCKKTFESSTEPIREHLYCRSRNMFPTTCEVFVQVVFRRECPILLVLCLECREHLVVDVTRLDQASHE